MSDGRGGLVLMVRDPANTRPYQEIKPKIFTTRKSLYVSKGVFEGFFSSVYCLFGLVLEGIVFHSKIGSHNTGWFGTCYAAQVGLQFTIPVLSLLSPGLLACAAGQACGWVLSIKVLCLYQ